LVKGKVDKFGRVLIPRKIRRTAGIEENTELEIEVKDEKIILKHQNADTERRINELIHSYKLLKG